MGAKRRKNKIPSNEGKEREEGTRRKKVSENQNEHSQETTNCILGYIEDMKSARDDTKRKQNMNSALDTFSQKIKVINDENLIKIFKTFKQSYIRLDIEDKKDFNEHLMKKLFEFAKLKNEDKDKEEFYKTLASSIIITILNDPNIKKNYKTIPKDLSGKHFIEDYDTFSNKFIKKTSSKKHDTSSKKHKQERINEIQKLFFCIISTAKIAFYSETPKEFNLDDPTSIIKNFLGEYHVNLEEDLKINFTKSAQADSESSQNKEKQTNEKSNLEKAYQKVIKDSIIIPNGQNADDYYELQNEHKLTVEGEFLTERDVDFYIHFKKDCKIKISDGFEIPILAGTEIIIEIDGPNHFAGFITPKNLKDAQQTILGQTVFRNDSIKRNFKKSALEEKSDSEEMTRGNRSLKDKLQNMVRNLKDKSASLLQYACRLEKFKQRRKIDNPEIIPIKSQETIENSNPTPPEPIDLTETNEDLIGVTAHSIRNSNLFFSIPGLKDQYQKDDEGNKTYDMDKLRNTFKNCFVNAYYLQALSNLKEFYRQEETENTQSTQQSEQEQNREKTTQSPLDKIKTAKDKEIQKINEEKKLEQEGLSIKIDTNGSSEKDNSESMTNTDSTKYIPDNISPLSPIASHDTLTSNSSSLTILSPTEFESYKTPETPRTPRTS